MEAEIRSYDPKEAVVFLKTNERFGGLSNMAPGYPIVVNGTNFKTSEALYQACRFPYSPDTQHLILSQHSPMTAKMRSKPHRAQTRSDWTNQRVPIMRWCLRAKLTCNYELFSSLLLETGYRSIVEMKTRGADFWGASPNEQGLLVGPNVLGRLLMELRDQVRERGPSAFEELKPLPIKDFLLFGEPIHSIWRITQQKTLFG